LKINTKDMEKIGFKGNGVFRSSWHQFYYRSVLEKKSIYIYDALDERVQHFKLTSSQWRAFDNGKLKLIPEGCCNASGGKAKENPEIDFHGDLKKVFKTKKKFLEYVNDLCTE